LGVSIKMEPSIYFVTTKNCNLGCDHCYLRAGPGQKNSTISSKDFEKVINNFPKKKSHVTIGGGEIFTLKNQPYEFLDILNNENRNRDKESKIISGVQSNGFWATDIEKTEKVLDSLLDYGVSYLDVASEDEYHFDKGLPPENIGNIEELAGEHPEKEDRKLYKNSLEVVIRGNHGNLMPLGNAKNLKEDEYIDFSF